MRKVFTLLLLFATIGFSKENLFDEIAITQQIPSDDLEQLFLDLPKKNLSNTPYKSAPTVKKQPCNCQCQAPILLHFGYNMGKGVTLGSELSTFMWKFTLAAGVIATPSVELDAYFKLGFSLFSDLKIYATAGYSYADLDFTQTPYASTGLGIQYKIASVFGVYTFTRITGENRILLGVYFEN